MAQLRTKMPRCLMAKKWKVYPWTADADSDQKPAEEEPKKHVDDDEEEEEEIDVVTIQQNTDTKQVIQYQQQSSHDDPNAVIDHSALPPQNYYQTSAEDYPMGENDSKSQLLNAVPSVIQQHTSHPTPQIRLTSVIHHSGTFLQNNSAMPQNASQSGMHHSASPMQPQSSWGPSSPTEGATAPSPPPHIQHSSDSDVTTIHYNGKSMFTLYSYLYTRVVVVILYIIFHALKFLTCYPFSARRQISRQPTSVPECVYDYQNFLYIRTLHTSSSNPYKNLQPYEKSFPKLARLNCCIKNFSSDAFSTNSSSYFHLA